MPTVFLGSTAHRSNIWKGLGHCADGKRRAWIALSVLLAAALGHPFGGASSAEPLSSPPARTADPHGTHITEASRRFGVPERWIRAVIHAESRGERHALSPAGAMGLMQIMPETWGELRVRHRLGSDPYAPRDNILAGTAYLAELYTRFGSPGFLAAYNAGPGRYTEYLMKGRPLPAETRAYVRDVAPKLGGSTAVPSALPRSRVRSYWSGSPLFATNIPSEEIVEPPPPEDPSSSIAERNPPAAHASPSELFIVQSQAANRRWGR